MHALKEIIPLNLNTKKMHTYFVTLISHEL